MSWYFRNGVDGALGRDRPGHGTAGTAACVVWVSTTTAPLYVPAPVPLIMIADNSVRKLSHCAILALFSRPSSPDAHRRGSPQSSHLCAIICPGKGGMDASAGLVVVNLVELGLWWAPRTMDRRPRPGMATTRQARPKGGGQCRDRSAHLYRPDPRPHDARE